MELSINLNWDTSKFNHFLSLLKKRKVNVTLPHDDQIVSSSLIDIVWYYIFLRTKDLQTTVNFAHNLKESLSKKEGLHNPSYLERKILEVLILGCNVWLPIDKHGFLKHKDDSVKFTISLKNILEDAFPGLLEGLKNSSLQWVNCSEQKILEFIREEKYHTVKVIKQNGIPGRIESEERVDSSKRIIDILKDHPYQDVQIKQDTGKITYINRVIKIKLNKP